MERASQNCPDLRFLENRRSVPSLVDGLEILRGLQPAIYQASIRASALRLPNGQKTAVTVLFSAATPEKAQFATGMPSSSHFIATTVPGKRQRFPTTLLDGAIIDMDGRAYLADDRTLRNIQFETTPMRWHLSERQRIIIRTVIHVLSAEARCLRLLNFEALYVRSLDAEERYRFRRPINPPLPEAIVLDFFALSSEKLPRLGVLLHHVGKILSDIKRDELADALAAAGMRQARKMPSGRHRRNRLFVA